MLKTLKSLKTLFINQLSKIKLNFKKRPAVTWGLILTFICATTLTIWVNAEEPISIGINIANKLDVALSVGPTTVDYSKFEDDVRAKLALKSPPVAEEDLYITAAKSVSANTTSEFSWWVYDHTKPANLTSAKGTTYGGVKNINDTNHTYIENDIGNATTSSNQGTVNTTVGNTTYTPDSDNPDIGSKRHPYQGINAHMIESNGGATMDFYGYAHDSFKDFRFLPNNQRTKKFFEFGIKEDVAYDALDGVGFFFNMDIKGNYEDKTQTMSGYLLFLGYNSSGKGANMTIYKFKDVNTYRFHQSMNSTSATTTTSYTIANYKEGTETKFTQVSRSIIYNATDIYRRIKLEVYPTYVKVYYNGSTSNPAVLTTPIAENASPVNFTTGTKGTDIPLDPIYISSYGFGPMASYLNHTCARPTHLALQNLSMQVDKVRALTEVVREPEWHENTMKFLVNLNEDPIEDFSSTSITGELLNRLRNDDIYYIGWCSDQNAEASQDFLTKNDLKGLVINIENSATVAYDAQIQAIADKIYERYWKQNKNDTVLVTDKVVLNISGAPTTDTVDPEWPNGKWKIIHKPDGFENNDGVHPLSGQYTSDLDLQFNKSGEYEIYYRDQFIKTVISHKPPVAAFKIVLNNDVPTFLDESYDPDTYNSVLDPNRSNTGIVSSSWSYLNIDKESSPTTGLTLKQLEDALPNLIEGDTYLISTEVVDKHGATSILSQQIRYLANQKPEEIVPPFADFDIGPYSILKGVGNQTISVTNKSYDLQGLNVVPTFNLTKDATPVELAFTGLGLNEIDTTQMQVGSYVLTLTVNNGYKDSVAVSRSFSIIEDTLSPTATATLSTGDFSVNTPITLNFSDSGGSGFKEQRVIITNNSEFPPLSNTSWTLKSMSDVRNITINTVGTSYVHWEATDYAGNVGTGTFGPYTLTKQDPGISLAIGPETSVIYPEPITLTATFSSTAEPPASGPIYFYINGVVIGNATIADNKAELTYSHTLVPHPTGTCEFSVNYLGDINYNSDSDFANYTIIKSSNANVTVGNQLNKTYDSEPFEPKNISVVGTAEYEIRYTGRDGTNYNSTSPPVNAGKYTITVVTTDPGYIEASDNKDFEIYQKEISLSLSSNPNDISNAMSDIELSVTVTGAINLPAGSIKFSHGNTQIGNNAEITFENDYKSTITWPNVPEGVYNLKAQYVPETSDNYIAINSGTILNHKVSKQNQTGFAFTSSSPIDKVYDNGNFFVAANGGQTALSPIYTLTTGSCVSVNSITGEVTILGLGTAIITASKPGDDAYNPTSETMTINIGTSNSATVTIGTQTNKAYDNTPFSVTDISVTGATTYKTQYLGRDNTHYALSLTPPTNAGKYTVVITTTDTNFDEKIASADFEITKRQLTLALKVNPTPNATAMDDINLSVDILNALNLPGGKIEFNVNNKNNSNVLKNDCAISLKSENIYTTSTNAWNKVPGGMYNITAQYTEISNDNYTSSPVQILDYDVIKKDQTDFNFSTDGGVTKTVIINKIYGDEGLTVPAFGGQSSANVTYTVTSGNDVVSINNLTGEITILKSGAAVITAVKPADDEYNQITTTFTINVNKKENTLTVALNNVKLGETYSPNIIQNEGQGNIVYTYTGRGGTVYPESEIPPTNLGTYTLKAISSETVNYKSKTTLQDFEIQEKIYHNIIYKNYDGSDISNLESTLPTKYVEDRGVLLSNIPPSNDMSGWTFLGYWDCPLNPNKKISIGGPGLENEEKLDISIGTQILAIPPEADKDITVYARYTSNLFDQNINGKENYIFGAQGVFPNGSKANIKILEPDTQQYQTVLSQIDQKDNNNIKIVEFEIFDEHGNKIQPKTFFGNAVIGFKIPEEFEIEDVSLLRVITNGEDIVLRSKVWTDPNNSNFKYIEGTTDHFSPYAIGDITKNLNDLSKVDGSGIIKTGDQSRKIIIISLVLLIISTTGIILLWKKQKTK